MVVDIERATALRLSGYTLQEVANELGCSLGWCKIALKGIKPHNKDKVLIDKVIALGRRKCGVTTVEINSLVNQHYNLKGKQLQDKITEIRRASNRTNKDVLIRPHWMVPDRAKDCTNTLMNYAEEIWLLKEQLTNKYLLEYDLTRGYAASVKYALTALSAGEVGNKLLPQGLTEYGVQLERIQDALASRNIEEGSLVDLEDILELFQE